MSNRVATLLQESLPGWRGEANLYELSPHYPTPGHYLARYVIVSQLTYDDRPAETAVFPAQSDSTVMSYLELWFCEGGSHEDALQLKGYHVN